MLPVLAPAGTLYSADQVPHLLSLAPELPGTYGASPISKSHRLNHTTEKSQVNFLSGLETYCQ